jgi:hypothetical protein
LEVVRKPGVDSAESQNPAIETGVANDKSKDAGQNVERSLGEKWFVRVNALQFRIESKMPINTANIGDGFISNNNTPDQEPIYARLTHEPNPVTSSMKVWITAHSTPIRRR